MQLTQASLALSFAAAAGLSGLSAFSPMNSYAATACASGTPIGRYSFKSQLNNKYVRAGIGSGSYVGAKSNRVGSWETFDIYGTLVQTVSYENGKWIITTIY